MLPCLIVIHLLVYVPTPPPPPPQALKTYHVYHSESKQAESKLRSMEQQKMKLEQQGAKGSLSRKYRTIEKQTEKVSGNDNQY